MNPGAPQHLTQGDLDLIASTFRMSVHFKRMRHTRRCRRCGCWLAVDQPFVDTCSPCQGALQRNGSRP
jgi:hypothetical protein